MCISIRTCAAPCTGELERDTVTVVPSRVMTGDRIVHTLCAQRKLFPGAIRERGPLRLRHSVEAQIRVPPPCSKAHVTMLVYTGNLTAGLYRSVFLGR